MAKAYLLLGSNLGDRYDHLKRAVSAIENDTGELISQSGIYETGAWGYISNNSFLNMALIIDTSLKPGELLVRIKKIEKLLGRKLSAGQYSDREIDIDIIFYDDLIIKSEELMIPHPLMEKRRFVLEPLAEIAPDYMHPVLGKTVRDLLNSCSPFEGG